MFTSGQVSEMSSTPPSTLRRYVQQFAAHLSDTATKKRGRRFSERDVTTITQIRELHQQGRSPEEIKSLLQVVAGGEDPTPDKALALVPSIALALTEALDTARFLRSEVEEHGTRLDHLEAWLREPWYRRMFRRPSGD